MPVRSRLLLALASLIPLLNACSSRSSAPIPEGFEIEKDFQLALTAAEPLIRDPVDMQFNEHGDAMVLEMPGYPFEDKQSRILVLKDTNHDGAFDKSVIFAEGLQLGTSFLPYKKGVLVAAPPYLLHVRDTDGDQRADVTDTLMGGFATENLQHNYNGLTYGIDNWIYAVNGGNSGKPFWWGDTLSMIDLKGQDLRFNLDTRAMELIGESSGGFGLGMDDFGRLYETHNLTHISHLVFPDRYLKGTRLLTDHTLSNISDHEENGLARIYPIGEQESRVNHPEQSGYFSGSCGITWYGGGAFGPEYDNTVWVADVVLNLVHVDGISANGATFSAARKQEKKEFLASSDRSFRPVKMSVGPQGEMYVIDMHRKVIEHPEWIPDEIEKSLDLKDGTDKGRIYRITRNGSGKGFEPEKLKSAKGRVEALGHPNQWVRKTAQRLILEETPDEMSIKLLESAMRSDRTHSRLHAMWILAVQKRLGTPDLLKLLEDRSNGIRENALQVAEAYMQEPRVAAKVLAMMGDADARVRMQAALSMSTLPAERMDPLKDSVMAALRKASVLKNDDWNLAAITIAAGSSAPDLFAGIAAVKDTAHERLLASLALASAGTTGGVAAVLDALTASGMRADAQALIVRQLTNAMSGNIKGQELLARIGPLESNAGPALLSALASLRDKLSLPPSPDFMRYSRAALKTIADRSRPDSLRIAEMALIELLPYREKSDLLFSCLENTEPVRLQELALRQLSKYRDVEIGRRVLGVWQQLGPQTRRYASDLLLYIEEHHDALLTGLENGTINIGEMNFDLERRRTLLAWTDNENTKRRARALFSDTEISNRKDVIERMRPALQLSGSPEKGALVFGSTCSSCHMHGSTGKDVGPSLNEMNRKSRESIMHEILDPNAAVDTKYISHRLETKSGELHIGIVDAENDRFITIKKMGGEKVTVNRSDMKSFRSLGNSLMPEGLEGNLTHQQMADLLAYLQK